MKLGERLSSAAKVLCEGTAIERALQPMDTKSRVSIQSYPETKRDFDLERGAVYLGPMSREPFAKKMLTHLDFRDGEGAYSDTGVLAVLQEALKKRTPGKPVKIILVGRLREFCNGDEVAVLSFQEQKQRILQLGMRHLGVLPEDLEFIDLADENPELFSATDLSSNVESIFLNEPSNDSWDSYRIAYDLYQVSRNNSSFREQFQRVMTDELVNGEEDSGALNLKSIYSLFETAIHLADIIKGRSTQIGVGRQSKYNELVVNILKGRSGPWKDIAALAPLFQKLEGLTFEGVNVSKSPSPVTSKIRRTRARLRIATQMGSVLALLGTGAAVGKHIEEQRKEHLDAIYTDQLRELSEPQSCRGEDNWMGMLSTEDKVTRLKYRLMEVREILRVRYGITYSDTDWEEKGIANFLDFLFVNDRQPGYDGICDFILAYPQYAQDMVDQYVTTQPISLRNQGYDVTRPYAYLGDLDFSSADVPKRACLSDLRPGFSTEKVGDFMPYNRALGATTLYQIRETVGQTYLAVLDENNCYSNEKIPEIEEAYKFTLRRWASLPIRFHNAGYSWSSEEPNELVEDTDLNIVHRYPPFVDPFGEFKYYLITYRDPTQNGYYLPTTLARREGEQYYSAETAMEAQNLMSYLSMPYHTANPLATKTTQKEK